MDRVGKSHGSCREKPWILLGKAMDRVGKSHGSCQGKGMDERCREARMAGGAADTWKIHRIGSELKWNPAASVL